MHAELCMPFCDQGMGVYCDTVQQVVETVRAVDPAPFGEAVKLGRHASTIEEHIGPLVEMLAELAGRRR